MRDEAMAHLPQRAEGETGGRPAAERRQEQIAQLRLLADESVDPGDAAERAAEDAGVNQRRTFQEQKEGEDEQPAADAIALAELDQSGQNEGGQQAGQGEQVDALQGVPGKVSGGRLLQGREQHEAEINALEEIFGLQPAHDGAVSLRVRKSVGLM